MANEDLIAIQGGIVAKERAKRIVHENNMRSDIRPQIARGGGYNPDGDFPNPNYQEYPKIVHRKDLPDVVVKSRSEENALHGHTPEPAKAATVDMAQVEAVTPEPKRRGRPPKDKVAPLPANLD